MLYVTDIMFSIAMTINLKVLAIKIFSSQPYLLFFMNMTHQNYTNYDLGTQLPQSKFVNLKLHLLVKKRIYFISKKTLITNTN